jgi:hypothetical protein
MAFAMQQRLPCRTLIVSLTFSFLGYPLFCPLPLTVWFGAQPAVHKTNRRLFIGNMNVLLTVGGTTDANSFLELFLVRFENQAANISSACQSRRQLDLTETADEQETAQLLRGKRPDEQIPLDGSFEQDEATIERQLYTGQFHPYVWHELTGSQYYFRYRGSWVEPPCLEDLTAEWRVMKEPIKISPDQFARLATIFYQRLNPSTCVQESAGRLRTGSTYERDFNRPTQTTTNMHEVTYCECIDFTSGYPNDKACCAESMSQRGVFPFQG